MLDTDTKRRIDTARDILVGKVPDPKSQVEQITIALIYKFMDDMDAESEEFGGKRKFFASEFDRYGWAKLMHSGLGGHEILNLYAEAITKMPENPGIPLLFRDIFKNAYLPYRDPETLRAFLKVIDEFIYDHSERLGDAFEYLLSVLGSQGDAGQFRTPRHIIDFIVEIVDPKKTETVLDPACGTAGFLISSYKHILKANTDDKGNNTLTPDENGRLAQNFSGYDIAPDMVRLSLVNMYLHGFVDPHIYEYDTLTSHDHWNEYADVILANPPFMSPKGGIRPHNRFSVQSKRSEVLFVDYMAEHLTPSGRAGIIVPESIIFQNQTAYKDLRKLLLKNSLIAVISLPAGAFNPYSGVKTSILILDKLLARKTDNILFLRVDNEGTDLGTRRRTIDDSQLPEAVSIYRLWIRSLLSNENSPSLEATGGCASIAVSKTRIANDGVYNLSAERYRDINLNTHRAYPMVRIGEYILESSIRANDRNLQVWSVSNRLGFVNTEEYFDKKVASASISKYKVVAPGYFAFNPSRINVGSVAINSQNESGAVSPMYVVFSVSSKSVCGDYLFSLIKSEWMNREINRVAQGAIRTQLRFNDFANVNIPLPPLEVQKQIMKEIKGYQSIIDGARAVLDNYHPHILIRPEWPMVNVGDVVEFVSGLTVSIPEVESQDGIPIISINNITEEGTLTLDGLRWIKPPTKVLHYLQKGDLLFNWRNGSKKLVGKTALFDLDGEYLFASFLLGIRTHADWVNSHYLWRMLNIYRREGRYLQFMRENVNGLFNREEVKMVEIPLPPLTIQESIVAEIEAEQELVNVGRDLIKHFEQKIQAILARVWGDELS
ncbi:N-6 DNA methylase [Chloroflexota bacterium]